MSSNPERLFATGYGKPQGDSEPPALAAAEPSTATIPPFEQCFVRPEWEGYYSAQDSGFNFWVYVQQTMDYIPTHTIAKNRYTIKMVELLRDKGTVISRLDFLSKDDKILPNMGYIAYKNVIVMFSYRDDGENYKVNFYHHPDAKIPYEDFTEFVVKNKENRISVLLQSKYEGIYSEPCDVVVPADMDLKLNYGDAFEEAHRKLVMKLENKEAGLYLLTGSPGTGKTTAIKQLSALVNREFIYMPVSMVSMLASPEMLAFLMTKKNAILVLEDSEKAVRNRDDNPDGDIVSTLLNLTDGILGNVLNISIIATYNAQRETVDKAFLRKGRLKFEHEFKALTVAESDRLLAHIGASPQGKEMTLAEIYNLADENGHVEKKRTVMGFGGTLN